MIKSETKTKNAGEGEFPKLMISNSGTIFFAASSTAGVAIHATKESMFETGDSMGSSKSLTDYEGILTIQNK